MFGCEEGSILITIAKGDQCGGETGVRVLLPAIPLSTPTNCRHDVLSCSFSPLGAASEKVGKLS